MKNVFLVLIISAALGLGFLIGKSHGSEQAEPVIAVPKTEMTWEDEKNWKELKEKLQGITSEQIREYLRTQNADEKLRKADEILGKIVAAMVANIGLRLENKEVEAFNSPGSVQPAENQPKAAPVAAQAEMVTSTTLPINSKRILMQLNQQAKNARTEEEVAKVLEKLPGDFTARLQGSSNLNREQVRTLRGNFEGTLFYDKNGVSVRTTLSFSGYAQGKDKVSGQAVVEIFDAKGKSISRGSSRGDLSKSFSGNELSVLIESGGDYMELIYFPNLDSFSGNFLQASKGQFVKTGRITYRRLN